MRRTHTQTEIARPAFLEPFDAVLPNLFPEKRATASRFKVQTDTQTRQSFLLPPPRTGNEQSLERYDDKVDSKRRAVLL